MPSLPLGVLSASIAALTLTMEFGRFLRLNKKHTYTHRPSGHSRVLGEGYCRLPPLDLLPLTGAASGAPFRWINGVLKIYCPGIVRTCARRVAQLWQWQISVSVSDVPRRCLLASSPARHLFPGLDIFFLLFRKNEAPHKALFPEIEWTNTVQGVE